MTYKPPGSGAGPRVIALAAVSLVCLMLAACTSESNVEPPKANVDSTAQAASIEAGKAAAAKAGPVVELPSVTVGNILFNGANETTQRTASTLKAATAVLGWNYIECDGQGTPTRWASCADSLISQGAKVLISAGISPSVLQGALQRAKDEGVLFFNTEATAPPGQDELYAGNYGPAETDASEALADFIIEKLQTLPESRRTIALINYDAVYGLKLRTDALVGKLEEANITVVDVHTLDFANVTTDVTSITNTWLTRFPDLGAIFSVADAPVPVIARTVAQRLPGKQFPDRPLVTGFLDSLQNLQAVRDGTADAIISNGTGLSSLVALDQAAEYFARGITPDKGNPFANSVAVYGVPLNEPTLVSQDRNLPAEGSYAASRYDVAAFFQAKWETEFTKAS